MLLSGANRPLTKRNAYGVKLYLSQQYKVDTHTSTRPNRELSAHQKATNICCMRAKGCEERRSACSAVRKCAGFHLAFLSHMSRYVAHPGCPRRAKGMQLVKQLRELASFTPRQTWGHISVYATLYQRCTFFATDMVPDCLTTAGEWAFRHCPARLHRTILAPPAIQRDSVTSDKLRLRVGSHTIQFSFHRSIARQLLQTHGVEIQQRCCSIPQCVPRSRRQLPGFRRPQPSLGSPLRQAVRQGQLQGFWE